MVRPRPLIPSHPKTLQKNNMATNKNLNSAENLWSSDSARIRTNVSLRMGPTNLKKITPSIKSTKRRNAEHIFRMEIVVLGKDAIFCTATSNKGKRLIFKGLLLGTIVKYFMGGEMSLKFISWKEDDVKFIFNIAFIIENINSLFIILKHLFIL